MFRSCPSYHTRRFVVTMSIRKYIAYLKTIETGSITHAASQLGYTQSAISRMIADL